MKKIFFSIVAIAAVAACAKTEPVYTEDNSEIKIAPATALATKANVLASVDGTEYPTKENFDVFAYWANEPAGSTFTTGTQYLINEGDNTGVEFINKGNYWGGKTTYYWPKNGSLRFAAYSPSSVNMTHVLATDTYTAVDYRQPHNTAETWDFLIAKTSPSYTAMTAAENVSVVFEHALSWITLKVKAMDAAAAVAFDVKKVTINSVNTVGTINAAMADGIQVTEWTALGTPEGYVVWDGSQQVTMDAEVIENTTNGTLVIPQATTSVTIDYTQKALVDGSGNVNTPALENQTITVDLVLDKDNTPWEPGKHYIYTLIFGLDEILINPSVVDWADVEVGEIDTDKEISNVSTPDQLAAAVANGGKVVLQNDITVGETMVVNKDLVLDLNGKTLKNAETNTTTDVLVVRAGAALTINGQGTIEAVSGNDGYAVISEGILIINGGTFKAGVDASSEANAVVYVRGNGQAYVNGGNFPNEANSVYVLNKKDSDRATTVIEVAGGTFENFNPGNNTAEGPNTNFLKAGYKVNQSGTTYTVVAE